ncbi:hypothetical protein JL721_4798 [Aureococcus anophagefferens]|nr:hypothetical protein JL721_4798 [Aureococcus anophagefferens]
MADAVPSQSTPAAPAPTKVGMMWSDLSAAKLEEIRAEPAAGEKIRRASRREKTSAFFTIMKRVFEFTFRPELEPGNVDDDVERVGVDASFAFFKEQMLRHSVEAPAEGSVGLFTVADVEFIAEFISTTRVRRRRSSCSVFRNVAPHRRFYRHFKAYSYCFYNKQPDEDVERTLVVETPLPPPPLAEATTDATNELAEPPAPAPVRAPVAEGLVDAE